MTAPLKIPASGRNRIYVAASPRTVACALDRRRQLPLVMRLGPGDPAWHYLARLRNISFQQSEILVIDLLDSLGSEAAVFTSA
jgi:hypothetical protein